MIAGLRAGSTRSAVLFAGLSALLFAGRASADVVEVSSAAELRAAIDAAAPGDEIVLAAGTYAMGTGEDGSYGATCDADGRPDAPIVVRSAVPLGAQIRFDASEGFHVSGSHWHFEGLDIQGVCATDDICEHAFHVVGDADDFVMRDCHVYDFNAHLKSNAAPVGGVEETPDEGLVEHCELFDTHPRDTSNPVTPLNMDSGDGWVVRSTYIHDFRKMGGDHVSYGAFMKSGSTGGLFERNLVVCTTMPGTNDDAHGTRIGLSFGGGGTGNQYCAPAFDRDVPCAVEHSGGIMRNNIIAACSDVGIYLNKSADTKLLFNTLIGTMGIDFRYDTTSGVAHGNLMASAIRDRDGATHTASENRTGVSQAMFDGWYTSPLAGDLRIRGDVGALVAQATSEPDVSDDYCGRARPAGMVALGALEHSLGDCDTLPPPATASSGMDGGVASLDAGASSARDAAISVDAGADAGSASPDASTTPASAGCGCHVGSRSERGGALVLAMLGVVLVSSSRRRRRARDS